MTWSCKAQNVQNISWSHKPYREIHKNLESGTDSRREKLSWSEGDALSPIQFIIAMIPITHILRKCTNSVNRRKRFITNVHGRHQTVCKKWKRTWNSNTRSQNIQSEHRNGIWHKKCVMLVMIKRQTTLGRWNVTAKSRQD